MELSNEIENYLEVNGEEIKYTILPMFDQVKASIFRVVKSKYGDMDFNLIHKYFGGHFRQPNDKDYIKAKEWVDMQMAAIKKANT